MAFQTAQEGHSQFPSLLQTDEQKRMGHPSTSRGIGGAWIALMAFGKEKEIDYPCLALNWSVMKNKQMLI